MLDNKDFDRIRDKLGLARGEQLVKIQSLLDERYPNKVRAVSLNKGVLQLATESSSVASELRTGQIEILKNPAFKAVTKLQILIQGDR
ncbi:MAG: DciA family protein [Candidatus Saccharimonadia bacterium]